jgi:hypothetical protein
MPAVPRLLAVLAGGLLLVAVAATPASAAPTYLALGDSVTFGY